MVVGHGFWNWVAWNHLRVPCPANRLSLDEAGVAIGLNCSEYHLVVGLLYHSFPGSGLVKAVRKKGPAIT